MSEKQYPLHHDHGTATISSDVFESMTAELERLRPMECGLELAEADRDAYKKKVEELKAEINRKEGVGQRWFARCMEERVENVRLKRALWLARAEKAKTAKNMFDILGTFASREKVGVTGCAHKIKGAKTLKEPKFFFAKFQIAENKCRAKAEQYKQRRPTNERTEQRKNQNYE